MAGNRGKFDLGATREDMNMFQEHKFEVIHLDGSNLPEWKYGQNAVVRGHVLVGTGKNAKWIPAAISTTMTQMTVYKVTSFGWFPMITVGVKHAADFDFHELLHWANTEIICVQGDPYIKG